MRLTIEITILSFELVATFLFLLIPRSFLRSSFLLGGYARVSSWYYVEQTPAVLELRFLLATPPGII